MRRIGVFGGTFDPPHYGHLLVAEQAREACGLDEVVFVPCGIPPHKARADVTSGRHRYLMTLLATLDQPAFVVSRFEVERETLSYTVETLRHMHRPDAELFFIGGADAIAGLPRWKEPEEILRLSHIVLAGRPGVDLAALEERLGPLYADFRDRFHRVEVPQVDISSSDIRRRVAEGRSIRYLVPGMVASYIERYGLYRQAKR